MICGGLALVVLALVIGLQPVETAEGIKCGTQFLRKQWPENSYPWAACQSEDTGLAAFAYLMLVAGAITLVAGVFRNRESR